jgi:hypothetical protein
MQRMNAVERRRGASSSLLALWGAVLLQACGGTVASAPSNIDGGTSDGGSVTTLCDGSDVIRLTGQVAGGGPIPFGTSMLVENGWQYLVVNGRCEAWILRDSKEPLRSLQLSKEQENAFVRDFRLSEWDSFRSPVGGGCPDASGINFRFGQHRYSGVTCGLDPAEPLVAFSDAFATQVERLYTSGVAVEADVRYLLVIEDPNNARDASYRNAPTWPLASAPQDVAVSVADAYHYVAGRSQRATGEGAGRLRAVRTSWLDGTIGAREASSFIPIADTNGARYELFARDAAPWEYENGLAPADVF